jgi:multisubunit Na+/H+ antiporter MnhB subunit
MFAALAFTISQSGNFFFWDTISQISIPANWFYDTNFHTFFLPNEIATGHPTFIAMYIAVIWKIFGRSIIVTHFALFPFVFGILFQINQYLLKSETGKLSWFILIIVILDATLISQMSMITFDTVQTFFFLWSVNCILNNKRFILAIAFTGLCLTSLRGVVCGGGIILFNLLYEYLRNRKISFAVIIPYIFGIIPIAIYLLFFYLEKHWIIHNVISQKWLQSSEFASFTEIFRNIGIIGWRLMDYGRLGLWIVFAYLIITAIKNKTLYDSFFRDTLLVAVTQLIIFFPVLISYRNFIGHRYLLPVIIPMAICTGYWIFKYSKFPKILFTVVTGLLISGYFWVYPVRIAQGWDATPAHWPYYKIRKEMITWMKNESIPVLQTGSFFPNLSSFKLTDLSDDILSFKEADLSKDTYILFSNVFNIPDYKIDDLFTASRWKEIKRIEKRNVYMILFKKK